MTNTLDTPRCNNYIKHHLLEVCDVSLMYGEQGGVDLLLHTSVLWAWD